MRLFSLLGENQKGSAKPGEDREITGLSADSRSIRPGFLFAALEGSKQDGRAFIRQAIDAGAAAVLGPPDLLHDTLATDIPVITDPNPRRQLARMAARFYSAQPRTIAAVTGTNGKTSVAYFTQQLWNALKHPAASLGTLGVRGPGLAGGASLTTPDPIELHRVLASMKQQGIDHLAMEASSHGLSQFRLDGVQVRAAAFTNLTRDHLDYHGDMAIYRAAKRRLFSELLPERGIAILNAESPEFGALRGVAEDRNQQVVSFGLRSGNVSCLSAVPSDAGWQLHLRVLGETFDAHFPVPGEFQVANLLCALAIVVACGDKAGAAAAQISRLSGVPGRLELAARLENGASILVDYAHTPDALAAVLATVRPHVRGRLGVVFGCGGDRDRGKRPEMGRIAAERADFVIVTDDNPRSEKPAEIRRAIMDACPDALEIGDRRAAIAAAMGELSAGDVLVLAGKGHEEGQIVGDEILPFNDAEVARAIAGGPA
ncbi:MAG: UDP-N-acetylmuramoyl-L-alanyl-D-glutamate--2,6-diaminopimelate ligase [Alphaproteobacteria bacterium]|nr:UDP-N-acetylmuramoyl-L-alanyl-D-glutamate--2,6-diaminopimelate ligase [Alphaproteobacteria bacterium]